ncbi:MAG: benzoyl-CoA-dihydrodiol lyase [Gammaproteobacteria bacterium]|nr:benzoyl-CoA-dihydrodiol lyase [Gammaproteobacteria bacterium]NIR84766.1 benzoyl-CoA-dihydrodiol lyase [Gammaproteobacteria bacterium]NIR91262.1 benzoyl-CoA-dihydrodiol lyase [Gammaproteobacteria bacterium]NIU05809.1 benzoyl-CoA-dihydrodiol lyase [Gammaproteobacteria bacterium]NIV52928.1 benzoyl-CoA-dihydrodiol lyase [Gammaproteobacteria bacterium]
MIETQTHPDRYRHWRLNVDGRVATLVLDVQEKEGLDTGYELKLNSYDLGVDIELDDAVQRLRFEHPEVGAVIIESAKERVFCAGANIRMLGRSTHRHKVNFCKFTNETRLAIEDAGSRSGQSYLCAINGTAAGGGYELALATDYIIMVDDGSTAVSLPELPLLGVLPGTGGLTRVVDKRKVRRDHADFLCTTEEGIKGKRTLEWRLVDELVAPSRFAQTVRERALEAAERSDRPADGTGVALPALERRVEGDRVGYEHVRASIDREIRAAVITVHGPSAEAPAGVDEIQAQGARFWPLAAARELEDLILHLRFNEPEVGTLVFKSEGEPARVQAYDELLLAHREHWLVREIMLLWQRALKRVDVSAKSLFALVEPDSCFTGTLFELVAAADRSFMLDGQFEGDNRPPPVVRLTEMNFGPLTMGNGLPRLQVRCLDDESRFAQMHPEIGKDLDAQAAHALGLVTFIPDDIDWEDEVRIALEERASFSPDALTGMEANLRFAGPETLETKIFGRLSAWQNWIFQRPNATGETGALRRYGTGRRPEFDKQRT